MTTSKHRALEESLDKAKFRSKHWEWKANEGTERITSAAKERDRAKEEAQVAKLAAVTAGDIKAWAENDLARVQSALAATEEAKRKAESETACLEVERMSLLLEIGAAKDEVCSLQSQAGKDKEAMEEDYQKALEVIFAYSYGYCVFKHNICWDHPEVPNSMPDSSILLPPEFFVNLRCPSIPAATEDTAIGAHPSEATKEPEENASAEDQS